MRAMNKELADNKRLLKQSMIKLKEADELEKEGDYKAAMGLNREARAEALKLYELRENLKMDREKIAAQREATAVTREYTQQSRLDTLNFEKRKEVLETLSNDTSYQTLRNRLTALNKDPEENAAEINNVRSQLADIKRQAEMDVGITLGDTQSAAQGQGFGRRYRFDIASGKMIPVE
jgi:predicted S18 family serine protease